MKYPITFITCINSIGNGLVINPDTDSVSIKPKYGFGGIGGQCIKPTALANVRKFYELTNCDIVGCGGVVNGRDVYEHILCGAKAVQIGSQFKREGIEVFDRISQELQVIMNPVWDVHNGKIPEEKSLMTFSMLLNLVETSNADSKELLWKFVKKYKPNISEKDHTIFDKLIGYAINYFNDVIKKNKKYKKPNKNEKKALEALINILDTCNNNMEPEDIQTKIYTVGKENGYKENLRDWFKLIYEVVFGDENGPRMGFFISFFGVSETKQLIKDKLN